MACPWAWTFKAYSFGTPGASRDERWDNEWGSVPVDKGAPKADIVVSGRVTMVKVGWGCCEFSLALSSSSDKTRNKR